jgi:acyl-CoA reductase-like NAD-dependent aldehyde dehydrogenase
VLEPEPGTISTMLREAAGVAAIIVPWNASAPESDIGALIDHATRDAVDATVQRACDLADRVLLPGGQPEGALSAGAFLTPTLAEAETGGYRQSGLGRLHGYDALADFTELKHICMPAGVGEWAMALR